MKNLSVKLPAPAPIYDSNYGFYIGILHNKENFCMVPNQLILDGVMDGYVIDDQPKPKLNGNDYPITLGPDGDYQSINALNSDELLELPLKKAPAATASSGSGTATTVPKNLMKECENTPYGFKLSEILNNVGDILKVQPNKTNGTGISLTNGWQDIAHLFIVQNAFSIKKNGCEYLRLTFTIKNVGSYIAQRVLFKDILPNGVSLKEVYLSSNGSSGRVVKESEYNLKGRGFFMSLPDIPVLSNLELTLILKVNCNTCVGEVNVGCIAYIAWNARKNKKGAATIILTKVSNPKMIN